jgi:hypothetical protein
MEINIEKELFLTTRILQKSEDPNPASSGWQYTASR